MKDLTMNQTNRRLIQLFTIKMWEKCLTSMQTQAKAHTSLWVVVGLSSRSSGAKNRSVPPLLEVSNPVA